MPRCIRQSPEHSVTLYVALVKAGREIPLSNWSFLDSLCTNAFVPEVQARAPLRALRRPSLCSNQIVYVWDRTSHSELQIWDAEKRVRLQCYSNTRGRNTLLLSRDMPTSVTGANKAAHAVNPVLWPWGLELDYERGWILPHGDPVLWLPPEYKHVNGEVMETFSLASGMALAVLCTSGEVVCFHLA